MIQVTGIRPLPVEPQMLPQVRLVLETVARLHGLGVDLLWAKDRHERIVAARHQAMYVLRCLSLLSTIEIGLAFNRDRTAVDYAWHTINGRRDVYDGFKADTDLLVARCTEALKAWHRANGAGRNFVFKEHVQ